MPHEFIAALTVLWCAVTYWLGGQEIPGLNRGFKWIRRYLLPAGLWMGLLLLGAIWWRGLLACVGLSMALHLGYGSSVVRYFLSGVAMALPSLIIGFHWTVVLPITYHTIYGMISLKDNKFRWAYVGLLMGVGLGIAYTTAIN